MDGRRGIADKTGTRHSRQLPQPVTSWDALFTEVALKLVAFIGVVRGVVSIKLAHELAVLAETLACEYIVGVTTLVVVEKLHYDRLGRCDPLWVLLPMLFKPAHLVVRVEDDGGSVRSGVATELVMQRIRAR